MSERTPFPKRTQEDIQETQDVNELHHSQVALSDAQAKDDTFEIERLRTEIDDIKLVILGRALDKLYVTSNIQYARWDEGETVDWRVIRSVCDNMSNHINRTRVLQ